jgi:hypothetical protein
LNLIATLECTDETTGNCENIAFLSTKSGLVQPLETYCWNVVAETSNGELVSSQTWHFTVEDFICKSKIVSFIHLVNC